MTSTSTFWTPAGSLTHGQLQTLAVPAQSKPSQGLYPSLLAMRLQSLIDQSQEAARSALEMSQEHLPEMWEMAQSQPASAWGQSLTSSDSMHSLISQIDWSQPGSLTSQQELPQDLQSLLEQLP